jgi:hypothetical protein
VGFLQFLDNPSLFSLCPQQMFLASQVSRGRQPELLGEMAAFSFLKPARATFLNCVCLNKAEGGLMHTDKSFSALINFFLAKIQLVSSYLGNRAGGGPL